MNRCSVPFFGVILGVTPFITGSIQGQEPQNTSQLAQELADLKRQTEDHKRKIRILESQLNSRQVNSPVPESSHPPILNPVLTPGVDSLEGKTGGEKTAPDGQPKASGTIENGHNYPPHYLPIPTTNTAVQLIANPNFAVSYDFNAFADDYLSPKNLPLADVNPEASKRGRINAHARATQFGFRTLSFTNIGEIKSEISLDFYGNPDLKATGVPLYHPRLRFAFIELLGFTIGQTTSNFLDLDAIGETVDYGTILAGSFRHGLVKYTFTINKQVSLALALEQPITDYTTNTTATSSAGTLTKEHSASQVPDFTAHLKYQDSFGHVTLRGVLRELRLKNASITPSQSFRKLAWGLGVSAKVFIHQKTNLFAQTNFGNGIGRFIILCNGESAFYDQATGTFDLQKAANGIVGLEHFWSGSLRSNIIYAHTFASVSGRLPALAGTTRVTKAINQFALNLIYSPIANLDLGVEYGHAERKTVDGKRGKANRITLGMLYKF